MWGFLFNILSWFFHMRRTIWSFCWSILASLSLKMLSFMIWQQDLIWVSDFSSSDEKKMNLYSWLWIQWSMELKMTWLKRFAPPFPWILHGFSPFSCFSIWVCNYVSGFQDLFWDKVLILWVSQCAFSSFFLMFLCLFCLCAL